MMAPYNGYGTLRDSEQNCRSLVPKPPKKDLRKLVNKDGMILRFVCTFQPRPDIGFQVRSAPALSRACVRPQWQMRPSWREAKLAARARGARLGVREGGNSASSRGHARRCSTRTRCGSL